MEYIKQGKMKLYTPAYFHLESLFH